MLIIRSTGCSFQFTYKPQFMTAVIHAYGPRCQYVHCFVGGQDLKVCMCRTQCVISVSHLLEDITLLCSTLRSGCRTYVCAWSAGLRPRDVALAKSLNEDKLSQLFVKVDKSTLDARLVAPHTHADLPEEARSLMVLKRGTGKETSEGLLFGAPLLYDTLCLLLSRLLGLLGISSCHQLVFNRSYPRIRLRLWAFSFQSG